MALLVLLVMTLAPLQLHGRFFLNDKAQHLLGFLVLTALGLLAWGTGSTIKLVIGLAALGGAIEVLQETSLVGRDAELMDWLADVAGILIVAVPILLAGRFRRKKVSAKQR